MHSAIMRENRPRRLVRASKFRNASCSILTTSSHCSLDECKKLIMVQSGTSSGRKEKMASDQSSSLPISLYVASKEVNRILHLLSNVYRRANGTALSLLNEPGLQNSKEAACVLLVTSTQSAIIISQRGSKSYFADVLRQRLSQLTQRTSPQISILALFVLRSCLLLPVRRKAVYLESEVVRLAV